MSPTKKLETEIRKFWFHYKPEVSLSILRVWTAL